MKLLKILPIVAACALMTTLISDNEKAVNAAPTSAAISSTRNVAVAAKTAKNGAKEIAWRPSFKAAMAESKRTGKPILVDFYATWCGPCKMLDETTYKNAAVIRESGNFIAVKVDVDKELALAKQYRIDSLPTISVLKPNGTSVDSIVGFRKAAPMTAFLKSAGAKARR